jgi:hypothetical protein
MEKHENQGSTRRQMLKITGVAAAGQLAACTECSPRPAAELMPAPADTSAAARNSFFTPEEFTLADELAELIIPADDHSPGARAARVAAFIDQQLHESFDGRIRTQWREGLKSIEALAQEMHGTAFMQASPAQRVAVLEHVSQNEAKPENPEEHFFRELKSRTAFAYYTSKIGIHDEMGYKGNVAITEFTGYDAEPRDRPK